MQPFSFSQPRNQDDALVQLRQSGAVAIAGGTTLVDLMKLDVQSPAHLVDINSLPLNRIESLPDGGVRIGAMVRNSDLAHDEAVMKRYPVLSQALLAGASAQLRNMATTGGNLMQRTRCYYFRDPAYAACNKRAPGSGCAALEGFNRIHAVLGGSEQCIATYPGDFAQALIALDGIVEIQGRAGRRTLAFEKLHRPPGDSPDIETVLEPGDLITAFLIPATAAAKRSAYLKIRDRESYEFALASAAVALEMANGSVRDARIALGGVATKPWRARDAERALIGKALDEDNARRAGEIAFQSAAPREHNSYKIALGRETVARALMHVAQMEI